MRRAGATRSEKTSVNDHAERKILKRSIAEYDRRRTFASETEATSRRLVVEWLASALHLDYMPAAELLADALASRATKRLGE